MEPLDQWLNQLPDGRTEKALRAILNAVFRVLSTYVVTATTIAIGTTTTKVRSSTTTSRYFVNGRQATKAATDDLWTLSGSVTNAKFNVYALYLDEAGNASTQMGVEAATLLGVKFPATPSGKCLIGYVTINPTGTGNFVGGTTPLGDATVVPNANYVAVSGAFDPTATI